MMGASAVKRKIVKMGNSYGSTYPREVLRQLGARPGDEVIFTIQPDGTVLLKKSRPVRLPDGVDQDFVDSVNDTISRYDAVISGLAAR